MSIELTERQQEALDSEGSAARVIDPRTSAEYVLVPARDFAAVQEILDDEQRQAAIRQVSRRNAARRANEE